MDFSDLADKNYIAGLSAGLGGLLRILLNVDPGISKTKQFALLFFAALPVGWSTYGIASHFGYEIFAFPAGFFAGIMALSIVSIVAKDGAGALFAAFIKRGDR